MLCELLGFEGYETRSANNAETALQMLGSYVPDLALLDIGLPGMNGYELARRLRSDPQMAGIKLIALTGYESDGGKEQGAASNFDDHLVKPVVIDHLLQVMRQLLRPSGG